MYDISLPDSFVCVYYKDISLPDSFVCVYYRTWHFTTWVLCVYYRTCIWHFTTWVLCVSTTRTCMAFHYLTVLCMPTTEHVPNNSRCCTWHLSWIVATLQFIVCYLSMIFLLVAILLRPSFLEENGCTDVAHALERIVCGLNDIAKMWSLKEAILLVTEFKASTDIILQAKLVCTSTV